MTLQSSISRFFRALAGTALLTLVAACGPAATPSSADNGGTVRTVENDSARLTVRTDRGTVEVGAPIRVEIEVSSAQPIAPPVLDATLGVFDVRPAPIVAPSAGARPDADLSIRTVAYDLSTFESGSLEIPAITLTLGAENDAPTLATDPIPVTVTSLIGASQDPKDFRDIKGVVDLPQPFDAARAAIIAGIVIAALLLVAGLVMFLRRARPLAPPLAADVRALRDLDALEAKRLPAAGRMHEFYVEVTDIARTYVERRFGVRAPELTTPEFLREARRASAISDEHQRLLAGFLRGADLVKFGGVLPTVTQCDDALDLARRFVRESAPVAAAPANDRPSDPSTLQPGREVPA